MITEITKTDRDDSVIEHEFYVKNFTIFGACIYKRIARFNVTNRIRMNHLKEYTTPSVVTVVDIRLKKDSLNRNRFASVKVFGMTMTKTKFNHIALKRNNNKYFHDTNK